MNNLQSAFAGGKALLAFITCGDPDLETTGLVAQAAVEAGATIIELNIPFSDPTAVDPVIQQANIRALEKGITTDHVFDFAKQLSARLPVPLVVSTYGNVVFSYGAQRFAARCRESGIQGIIIPDVPYEERMEFLPACRENSVALISMLAVTSRQRVAEIASQAQGFLYIMACPGTREQELTELLRQVKAVTDTPTVICLTGTEQCRFETVAERTDGVAVDVPIVSLVGIKGVNAPGAVAAYIEQLKQML